MADDLRTVRLHRGARCLRLLKEINDSNGHAAGDEILNLIARVGNRALRETDMLGRWGGDEFLLLLPETDSDQAHLVCRRLKDRNGFLKNPSP